MIVLGGIEALEGFDFGWAGSGANGDAAVLFDNLAGCDRYTTARRWQHDYLPWLNVLLPHQSAPKPLKKAAKVLR